MAVVKRGKVYHLYLRPFGGKQITVRTSARTKTEAKQMEMALMSACRSSDYRSLDSMTRETCIKMFRNQGWEIPSTLVEDPEIRQELTLWKAMELFLKYPEVRKSTKRERYQQCLVHLVEIFGKGYPIKSLWIPEIKQYQMERLNAGAAPATVNREKSTLSRMLQVLVELRYLDSNPARLVKNLSERSGERQVYLGHQDFCGLVRNFPSWLAPVAQTAYYTGMRQGEILGLRREHLILSERMIVLAPEDVKEAQWKWVPIHRDLVPILEGALKVRAIDSSLVFLTHGHAGSRHSIKKPWHKATEDIGYGSVLRFHDLRHTWKTNARRSGMDQEIRESIMGHWLKEKSVSERYGRISDAELIQAIDLMSFDHGPTEILIAGAKKEKSWKKNHLQPGKSVGKTLAK